MGWKVLNLDSPNIPKLLVKAYFDSSGYKIHLTDLSRIWSESENKDGITQRALEAGSSIDPGEDDEQFKILLGKIESALSCENGTTLNIASAAGAGSSDLQLDLTAPLPKPLTPFKWTLQLQQQPEQHIESELVSPLVLQSSNLSRQVQQLIDELHDKDRVISKICDRLETSGNDLTTVFPGVSNIKTSRKRSQREQLAKHVKGLGDFGEHAWRQAQRTSSNDELDGDMINDTFWDLPSVFKPATHQVADEWWKQLSGGLQAKLDNDVSRAAHANRSGTNGNDVRQLESTQDDEFQRQETPPDRKTHAHAHDEGHAAIELEAPQLRNDPNEASDAQQLDGESTTDGEDDLDAPPQRKKFSQQLRPRSEQRDASSSPKGIGTIGGRRYAPAVTSTADRTSDKDTAPSTSTPKLGTIGGKSKRLADPEVIEDGGPTQDPSPRKTLRMGVIGGKKALSSNSPPPSNQREVSPAPPDEPLPKHSNTSAKETTPSPPENLEERADQKRDQLKRELEEKAKAPVKKKRKF